MAEPDSNPAYDCVAVDVRDVNELYAIYMPFITNGGLFLNRRQLGDAQYDLGDQIAVLLRLDAAEEQLRVETRVVWVTPSSQARGVGGIGVQLMDNGHVQSQVERMLTGMLQSERPTLTL